MRRHPGRRIACCLLATGLLGTSGCLCYFHPVAPAPPEYATRCQDVPLAVRDHVYIFIIHGLDPLNFANLSGVRDYIQRLGFNKTYYGQLYHAAYFKKEMQRIYETDPEAHFVLIGFSFGANMVRDLALAAKQEGVDIDLLVYLGGNTLKDIPRDRPDNAHMVVNILASGCIWNGTTFSDAENFHLPDVWHFGSPTHRVTLEALARDLAVVAGNMPAPQAEPAMPAASATDSMPRTPTTRTSNKRDEWDFLKPMPTLSFQPDLGVPPEKPGAGSLAKGR